MPEKHKRVLKAGYKRVRTSGGKAYYINERTGNRVLKKTATRAGHKRRVGAKRRLVHRKKHRVARRH